MDTFWLVVIVLCAVAVLVAMKFIRPKPAAFDTAYFERRWKELQKYLRNDDAKQLAVIEADKLLDEALKQMRMAGKTMGERMVSAQRFFSNNNKVWVAHKLRNRLVHEDTAKLRRGEIEDAMRGFRQALKDIGALR